MHIPQHQMGSGVWKIGNIGMEKTFGVQDQIFVLEYQFDLFVHQVQVVTNFFQFEKAFDLKLNFSVGH